MGIRIVSVCAKCSTDKDEAYKPTFFLCEISGVAFIMFFLRIMRKKKQFMLCMLNLLTYRSHWD